MDNRGSLSLTKTLDIFVKVADAFRAVHAKWIIHRDIKLDNIMISRGVFTFYFAGWKKSCFLQEPSVGQYIIR